MDVDLCSTFDELETKLDRGEAPVFFYSLPQNVHITVASQRKVPAGESYPGFFPRVASSVYRLDRCVGQFVAFLKATKRYDDSIIMLTADHGDSLGEEGRWGHAHYIVPEVMRVPLIVHLPTWMKTRVTADLDAASFLTDITPTLYSLLGHEPAALGPLFGRPLFVGRGADESWRRRETFLLGSSYGAVYAVLRNNGTEMYVVDAVDGRDDLFDMDAGDTERLALTRAMTMEGRGLIRERLDALAAKYGVRPR
jgi:arylsulfatase A-like enzyme